MFESSLDSLSGFRAQVAALPVRLGADGRPQILLITSRKTGRWIIPRGWPMKGRSSSEAAAREAFEEAGILGRISRRPLGTYFYEKQQKSGHGPCKVTVYLLEFERQCKDWREKGQRHIGWFSKDDAAARVHEPGLRAIILSLSSASGGKPESTGHVGSTG